MKATIQNIREIDGAFEFTVNIENRLVVIWLPKEASDEEVEDAIKAEIKAADKKAVRLKQLKNRFLNKEFVG